MSNIIEQWAGSPGVTWDPVLKKPISIGSHYKIVPTEGYLAWEYNPLRNYRLSENMYEKDGKYYSKKEFIDIVGDVTNSTDDVEQMRQMIEENPYPENVKAKILEELARYEMLPAASGESGVLRTYIDWLLKTPWWQMSEDNEDLNLVQKRLDEDHYGLDKVKERILEYLAVRIMTKENPQTILCLVGPPGVGKTSLAKVMPYMLLYYIAILIGLLLVTYVPFITLGLPGAAGMIQKIY